MSYDDEARRRRASLMDRRLRKARGEEVEDDLDTYDDYEDYDRPRPAFGGGGYGPARGYGYGGGGGCGQAVLFLLLGATAMLLVGWLVFSQTIGSLGSVLRPPSLGEILATPTPQVISGAAVVQRVQQLSRLETSSYTIETVIEVNQSQGNPFVDFFAGDALLLIAHGTVVAGIDLGRVTAADVAVNPDGSVTLRLPSAEIFTTDLDNSRTRIYSRDRGWFAPQNVNLETRARREAEARILEAACEDGILTKATEQAEASLRQFLTLVDGVIVEVVPTAPGACGPDGTATAP